MANPNWSHFRVIPALKNEGSISGAARILGVDGSTVSYRLASAEQAFGTPIIYVAVAHLPFHPKAWSLPTPQSNWMWRSMTPGSM